MGTDNKSRILTDNFIVYNYPLMIYMVIQQVTLLVLRLMMEPSDNNNLALMAKGNTFYRTLIFIQRLLTSKWARCSYAKTRNADSLKRTNGYFF